MARYADFADYLLSRDKVWEQRANKFNDAIIAAEHLCPEPIKDVFVIDNVRQPKIWFFSDSFILECPDLFSYNAGRGQHLPALNIKLYTIKHKIFHVDIVYKKTKDRGLERTTKFFFEKASADSVLFLRFNTDVDKIEIDASGDNCNKLKNIYERFIKPNVSR